MSNESGSSKIEGNELADTLKQTITGMLVEERTSEFRDLIEKAIQLDPNIQNKNVMLTALDVIRTEDEKIKNGFATIKAIIEADASAVDLKFFSNTALLLTAYQSENGEMLRAMRSHDYSEFMQIPERLANIRKEVEYAYAPKEWRLGFKKMTDEINAEALRETKDKGVSSITTQGVLMSAERPESNREQKVSGHSNNSGNTKRTYIAAISRDHGQTEESVVIRIVKGRAKANPSNIVGIVEIEKDKLQQFAPVSQQNEPTSRPPVAPKPVHQLAQQEQAKIKHDQDELAQSSIVI